MVEGDTPVETKQLAEDIALVVEAESNGHRRSTD
jgi:hypothetical protein